MSRNVKTMHTKQLLNELRNLRAQIGNQQNWSGFSDADLDLRRAVLKQELAGREHVPNKQEARAIRQQRAQGNG